MSGQTSLFSFFGAPQGKGDADAGVAPMQVEPASVAKTAVDSTTDKPTATAAMDKMDEAVDEGSIKTPSPLRQPRMVSETRVVAARPKRRRGAEPVSYAESRSSDDEGSDDDDDVPLTQLPGKKARRRRVIESASDDEFVPDSDEEREAAAEESAALAELAADARAAPAPSPPPAAQAARVTARGSPRSSTTSFSRMGLSTKAAKRAARKEKFQEENSKRFRFLVKRRDGQGREPGTEGYDASTLYIAPEYFDPKRKLLSGFERQYWEIKKDLMDTIVFFKKGKFYELFEEDADVAHQELDLKMTERVNMRMCGVPEAQFDKWAAQLVALGHKVARVDQVETKIGSDIAQRQGTKAKGASLIRRKLTQVLTTGTLVDESMLGSADARYLMAIHLDGGAESRKLGVAFVDCATGKFHACALDDDEHLTLLETVLVQLKPREVLLPRGETPKAISSLVRIHTPSSEALVYRDPGSAYWTAEQTLGWLAGATDGAAAPEPLTALLTDPRKAAPLGALLNYLDKLLLGPKLVTQGSFSEYDVVRSADSLVMDGQTLYNLNVLNNSHDGSRRGTLLELAQFCVSPFGRRRFRHELAHPLARGADIRERQAAVEALRSDQDLADKLTGLLRSLPDLERLVSRIHAGSCPLHKFVDVLRAFQTVSETLAMVSGQVAATKSSLLSSLVGPAFPDLRGPLAALDAAFDWDRALQEGAIQPTRGAHPEYDALADTLADLHRQIDAHIDEVRSQLRTKVMYKHLNKERYQLTVPTGTRVPHDWVLKSNTKSVKRYWSPFLVELLPKLDETDELARQTQIALLSYFEGVFDESFSVWSRAIDVLAQLDVLCSLRTFSLALAEPKCAPVVLDEPEDDDAPGSRVLRASELRHPTVKVSIASAFIPNDVTLGGQAPTAVVLTGPNMGGKSTLLRSVCVAVILAQMGAYVPAASMEFHPVDRIFTRIGAHDHILRGQSTFMVELLETAAVLRHGTPRSLVIMDELGRGTSTFDGYAIAYAVLNELIDALGARTLFSTHYHALCEEFTDHPRTTLQHMACHAEDGDDQVTFLYKMIAGVASKSYGMNVAKMAGVPHDIVDRATAVAAEFEMSTPAYEFRTEYSSLSPEDRALFRKLVAALSPATSSDA